MAEVIVRGTSELIAKFKTIDVKMQTTVINDVLDAAAKECQEIASQNAPQGAGTHGEHLADSIEVEGKGHTRQIGPNRDAYWGKFVEKGTGERKTKRTHFLPVGVEPTGTGSTGSMPAKPFLEPAIEDARVETVAAAVLRAKLMAL